MKNTIKLPILIIFTFIFFTSCSSREDNVVPQPPKPPIEKSVYNFIYNNYELLDVNLYKGPKGEKENADREYYKKYYGTAIWNKIKLDLKNDSISLRFNRKDDEFLKYKFRLKEDSIFINYDGDDQYLGIFDKNTKIFKIDESNISIVKVPREEGEPYLSIQKTNKGDTKYKNIFGGSNWFSKPSDLIKEGDKVFWCNLSFYYVSE
ncbi:hypothetical protein C8J95_1052 [Elizabethkingia sp. YR214]|uniref:hypothetical protein n=1 Tax=Elizabethkingia sp. YR214 TaxID=2135667 RepID=UPI000D2FDE92|nr:hypothetical protein [Elizabethkingia sp. YR214]PUB30684.1 hypothetical protein C8J95_1052 [Elizabethkingia sp. YR214]